MTNLLLDVSDYSCEKRRVLLPVLVVNGSGQKLPSVGFYESLQAYRPNDSQDERSRQPQGPDP
jgi:hypothetical protein